jgi:thiol-disulfide isomerase/thioredoxin
MLGTVMWENQVSVHRLSLSALRKIIAGQVKEETTCVIKFYSSDCHLCHNLKEYYEDISNTENYKDVHFFAFNVDSYPAIEKQLKFNGVPTISLIKTYATPRKPKIRILGDPSHPNKETWYTTNSIKDFIEEEK